MLFLCWAQLKVSDSPPPPSFTLIFRTLHAYTSESRPRFGSVHIGASHVGAVYIYIYIGPIYRWWQRDNWLFCWHTGCMINMDSGPQLSQATHLGLFLEINELSAWNIVNHWRFTHADTHIHAHAPPPRARAHASFFPCHHTYTHTHMHTHTHTHTRTHPHSHTHTHTSEADPGSQPSPSGIFSGSALGYTIQFNSISVYYCDTLIVIHISTYSQSIYKQPANQGLSSHI